MSHDQPLRSVTGRDIPRERRCDLKVLAYQEIRSRRGRKSRLLSVRSPVLLR